MKTAHESEIATGIDCIRPTLSLRIDCPEGITTDPPERTQMDKFCITLSKSIPAPQLKIGFVSHIHRAAFLPTHAGSGLARRGRSVLSLHKFAQICTKHKLALTPLNPSKTNHLPKIGFVSHYYRASFRPKPSASHSQEPSSQACTNLHKDSPTPSSPRLPQSMQNKSLTQNRLRFAKGLNYQ